MKNKTILKICCGLILVVLCSGLFEMKDNFVLSQAIYEKRDVWLARFQNNLIEVLLQQITTEPPKQEQEENH